jgi:predicted Zn-dependent protease
VRRLRIRIPSPSGLEGSSAREIQEAAARGVRAWHGRPFDLAVDLSDRPGDHDFVVAWSPRLGGRQLGRTGTHWVRREGTAELQVREFSLATHNPANPSRPLPPYQVELTAAHEMGHVLGLPHSDDPEDVMYPENTATRLTSRDFLTLYALYGLENGAFIR